MTTMAGGSIRIERLNGGVAPPAEIDLSSGARGAEAVAARVRI
jgi:hypothetical protein